MKAESAADKAGPDIEADENLGFLIHEAAQAISVAYGTVMAPLGLTRPQVRVIVWVEHSPGITQAELCDRIGISPMSMTGLLDRMELKHLVKRVEDPADRRVKRIFLTHEALKLKPDMDKIATVFRQQARKGISKGDITTVIEVLKKFKTNVSHIKEEAQQSNKRT
ncbi:MAG: MarR family winged helix-turn-helix transcriptional regulator [Gammaproteobacteria bacterium]|nr:MarR family winged helix-turn-helix transcriptional regulator [Gammaproteobacteria bacterium]